MKELKILLSVSDKIEAFDIVSKLGFTHDVLWAEFDGKSYLFDKKEEETSTKKFLSEKFDQNNISITK